MSEDKVATARGLASIVAEYDLARIVVDGIEVTARPTSSRAWPKKTTEELYPDAPQKKPTQRDKEDEPKPHPLAYYSSKAASR